jgi:hypothetical protein
MNSIRTLQISIILLLISFNYLDGQLLSWSNFRSKDTCGLKCLNGGIYELIKFWSAINLVLN